MSWKPTTAVGLAIALVAPLAAFADSPTDDRTTNEREGLLTRPPSGPPPWALRPVPRVAVDDENPEVWVQARRHDAPVFSSRSTRGGKGMVRYGTALPATEVRRNEHCSGRWLKLDPGGFVCTTIGFRTFDEQPESPDVSAPPNVSAPLPYRYAMVTDREAHRFDRLPTERELERVREDSELPGLAEQLDGDYFVTVADEVEHLGETWVRTAANAYVPRSAIEEVQASRLSGVHDPDGLNLPMAFVHVDTTPVVNASSQQSVAPKYARFEVKEIDDEHVLSDDGVWVPRDAVRVVRLEERPDDVPEDGRWIHVNLDEQTIVAYQGDTPVFASLVATGKEGYDTPTGTFRIRHKYVSITMRGDDPTDGVYDVAEVPWTMYYHRSYALHGAYWHDSFGNVRSHGCTNIAPADARFLFTWTTPRLPDGWHGVRDDGTWVHLTRAADETDDESAS
ncbi:MAG: L,D-transpeptidase [Deltaproteobacteria bacterium]|nr:L,D-transpeptidase [Deltaproteobacteria bacterium]